MSENISNEAVHEAIKAAAEYGLPIRSIDFHDDHFTVHVGFDHVEWARLELERYAHSKSAFQLSPDEFALLRKMIGDRLAPDVEERVYG